VLNGVDFSRAPVTTVRTFTTNILTGIGTSDTTAPPAPALLSPADGAFTNDNTPTFDWSDVTDPSIPVAYELIVDNNSDFSSPEIFLKSENALPVSTFTPSSPLPDSTYSWKVRARDGASNLGDFSSPFSFVIDTVPPSITSISDTPDPFSPNVTPDGVKDTTVISFTSNEAGTYSIEIKNSAPVPITVRTLTGAMTTGINNVVWDGKNTSDVVVPDGAYTYFITATDAANNSRTAPVGGDGMVTVDNTGPAAPTLLSPPDNFYTNDKTPTFHWSDVLDPSGVTYDLTVDNDQDFLTPEILQLGLTSSEFTPSTDLDEDTYYWKVKTNDGAGNDPPSLEFSVTVDITPPETLIDTAIGGDSVPVTNGGSSESTSITFTFSSNESGSTFECSTDEADFESCTTPLEITGLIAGAHTFKVQATDLAGNTELEPAMFSWKINQPPVLESVGNQEVEEATLLTFTAMATDPDQVTGQTLTFSLADGVSGDVPDGASITTDGDFTWTPTTAQGPILYTFDVVVTDNGDPQKSDFETIQVSVVERKSDYSLSQTGNNQYELELGFQDCVPSDGPCNLVEMEQQGTGTVIDAQGGLIGAHFDTSQPVDKQVCLFPPTVGGLGLLPGHSCTDHTANPIFEHWVLHKSGVALTPSDDAPVQAECSSLLGDGETKTCDEGRVTRTLSFTGQGVTATCVIEYVFTNIMNHIIQCSANVSGSYTLKQHHTWSTATNTVTQADGTSTALTEVCKEANMVDLLKTQIKNLQTQGVLKSDKANTLIKLLDLAKANLNKNKAAAAIKNLNDFKKQVNSYITSKILTQQQGQILLDAADAIIQNINNPVQNSCILIPELNGDSINSLQFNDASGNPIILEDVAAKVDDNSYIGSTLTQNGVIYEYGPFPMSFQLDPATSTLSGATGDGQIYSKTSTTTSTNCGTVFTKDTTSTMIRATSGKVGTTSGSASTPVCSRAYMQWDIKPMKTQAGAGTIDVTSIEIVFTPATQGGPACEFRGLVQFGTTAPSSRSASTLWGQIDTGTSYGSNSCSSLTLLPASYTDMESILSNASITSPWFAVGISLTNDNARSTLETDYANIISANGTSKPQLKVTFTILSS
jgi:hypothetical protein